MRLFFRMILLCTFSALLISGCGGEADDAEVTSGDQPGDADLQQDTDETPIEDVEEPPTPEPVVLYPEGTLNPAEVSADVPVSAKALFNAYYAWDGKEVTLTGYCYIPYMRDTMTVMDEMEMIPEIESSDRLADMEFAEPPGILVNKDQPITIRGTVDYYWTGDIVITDAELLPEALPAEDIEISPWSYDGTTPMAIQDFSDIFSIWIGKEVTVEGYYHSTTTSSSDYGTTIRVDIGDPEDIYTKYVGCEMVSEPPETLADDRYGVQIRGTIEGEAFDMVSIVDCELVNR